MIARLAALAASLVLACSAQVAHAYCRTRTTDPDQSSCPGQCAQDGLPLTWFTSRIRYAPNELGFPGFAESELRATLEQSVRTWTEVTCNGEPIRLEVTAEAATSERDSSAEGARPSANVNVIALLSASEWTARGYSPAAYAITGVWYNKVTGELVGADTMFNGGMGRFAICPPEGCPPDSGTVDLQNVATHEFGHLLGLSHSDVEGSTMWCGASSDETDKRTLEEDDVAGLCAAYGDPQVFVRDREVEYRGGGHCAALPTSPGSRLVLGLMLSLAVAPLTRRMRKRAREGG